MSSTASQRGAGWGPLCFLGPLHELVAIGLHRPSLDALSSGDRSAAAPPIDRGYLLKVLEEEVTRQFGHPLRPMIELILNAADALRHAAPREPIVDVAIEEAKIAVSDGGEGMNLRAILSRLLLPFATDREPGVDLGRFGVGFFSVLGLGIADPASFSLHVETGDGVEGWSLRAVATGPRVAALTVSVRAIPPRRGTQVRVASALLDADVVRGYLRDSLHFFPRERAVIRLDGRPLNDGSAILGGAIFEERAGDAGAPIEPPLVGRFHLGGRAATPGITAATYHAGVRVEPCFAIADLALLDFPAAVELTEGRDALKPGPAFASVVASLHRRLARIAEEPAAGQAGRHRVAELAAQISALMLQSAAWPEVADELRRALLGERVHLVSPEREGALLGFLGPEVRARLFVPESFWAEREWHPFLPGERELLEDELTIEPVEPLLSAARRRPDLGGLEVLASRSESAEATPIALVRGRRAAGPLPCLGTRHAVLVRADAPAVQAPRGWTDLYALRVAFDRATGAREADVERDLIVSAPIRDASALAGGAGGG